MLLVIFLPFLSAEGWWPLEVIKRKTYVLKSCLAFNHLNLCKNKTKKHLVLDRSKGFLSDNLECFWVGCPTSYSCHVDSVLLYSKFEAKQIKYWNSKFKYLQIRYSSIPRRTWLFQIFLRDIRDIRETDFNV